MNDRATDFSGEATERHSQFTKGSHLTQDCLPSEDELYMNSRQLEYFRGKLLFWREQLSKELDESLQMLKEGNVKETDVLDQGTEETNSNLRLRSRDRCLELIDEIDDALERIENGTYGYCEETGEEIGLKRLEARPIARLCLEAQEWRERGARRKARWNFAHT